MLGEQCADTFDAHVALNQTSLKLRELLVAVDQVDANIARQLAIVDEQRRELQQLARDFDEFVTKSDTRRNSELERFKRDYLARRAVRGSLLKRQDTCDE